MLAVIALVGFAFSGFAQDGAKKAVKKVDATAKEVKQEVKAIKTDPAAAKAVKQEVKAGATKAAESKVVLKKDGTPDKRYKTAKEVVLKKDGTPDKRYKK